MDQRGAYRFRQTAHELLLRIFGWFLLGCILGSIVGLLWPDGLFLKSNWTLRLAGERVPYGRLLLQTLRFPAFFCLCASAGRRRAWVKPALCLHGFILSYAVGCLLKSHGLIGLLMVLFGQFFTGFLPLPLLFCLALRSGFRRRFLPPDGAGLRLLPGILLFCVVCAALEYWFSPIVISFLLWISG